MSILIKKMEMPKGCWACPFAVGKHYECLFTKKSSNWGLTTRPSDCPIVEVPTTHGRLGDLDKLKSKFRHGEGDSDVDSAWISTIRRFITQADTIIEAEGSENENHNV